MKEVAFIFPGQGRIPSGPPPPSPLVDSLLDLAADLGLPLREWFADRPEERFSATRAAQPALFIDSIARDCALRSRGIVPAAVAGHSLGEYVALVSAGVLSPSDALEIVIERGRLMERSSAPMPAKRSRSPTTTARPNSSSPARRRNSTGWEDRPPRPEAG